MNSIEFAPKAAIHGMVLNFNEIHGDIRGSFRIRGGKNMPWMRGKFEVHLKKGAVRLTSKLPVKLQDVNGRMLPLISVENLKLSFDNKRVDIKLSGSIAATLTNTITVFIKGPVLDAIAKAVDKSIPKLVESSLNKLITDTEGLIALGNGWNLDYSFPGEPMITDESIGAYFNGTVIQHSNEYLIPSVAVSDMPLAPAAQGHIVLDASSYVVDSFLMAIFNMGIMKFEMKHDEVDSEF